MELEMKTLKPSSSGARPNHKHHRGGGEPSSSTPMLALINRDGGGGDDEDGVGVGGGGGSASRRNDRDGLPAKRHSFMLFERASAKWWNPQFESKVLERQFWKNSFPHLRTRFRWGLAFIVLSYSMWTLYSLFALHWRFFGAFHIPAFSLIFAFSFLLIFTYFRPYERFYLAASACAGILLFFSTVLCFIMTGAPAVLSVVAMLAVSLELVLITYTIIPLPLYVCVLGGLSYSAIVEVVLWQQRQAYSIHGVVLLLHICIHVIGIHTFFVTQVRERNTFLKIGESLMARHDLDMERQLKQLMIESVMPKKVADSIMQETEMRRASMSERESEAARKGRSGSHGQAQVFRPFQMREMENVSILFADIAGFTRMAANKSADELVDLLNDLFGRFDRLCSAAGCDKISTLGDCYYCVSGCPEAREDHAKCCVEMGLGMIEAIRRFDEERAQSVNMRVGIHTGTVMAGIVGTKRFKFDVFSNDVTLANQMESTGRAGAVHISQVTAAFVSDLYELQEGDPLAGMRTYFVVTKKAPLPRLVEGVRAEHSWSGPTPEPPDFGSSELPMWAPKRIRHIDSSEIESDYELSIRASTPNPSEPQRTTKSRVQSSSALGAVNNRQDSLRTQLLQSQTRSRLERPRKSISLGALSQELAAGLSGVGQQQTLFQTPFHAPVHESSLADLVSELRGPGENTFTTHFQQRTIERTDRRLAHCLAQEGSGRLMSKDAINPYSMQFREADVESAYREHFQGRSRFEEKIAAPHYSVLVDVAVGTASLLLVCLALVYAFAADHWLALGYSLAAVLASLGFFAAALYWTLRKNVLLISGWVLRHVVALVLIVLPLGAVLLNIRCGAAGDSRQALVYQAFCVVLIGHCNFSQVTSWVKSIVASMLALAMLLFALTTQCPCGLPIAAAGANLSGSLADAPVLFEPFAPAPPHCWFLWELALSVALLLLLVWYLNWQFETVFRMSFYGHVQALHDIAQRQTMKEQADALLSNIIPDFVVDKLKAQQKYSENHQCIAVIFASIVNWSEMYEESYQKGREFLRVLNEVMSDFDELLDRPQFAQIEKIKTIGSAYMAAAGLNPGKRDSQAEPNAHLYVAMEFALALQETLANFNRDLLNFDFIMKIGFNVGPVTAGVIGTTKLYYDIWGDTVNIASRMYSTGVVGRIQVPGRVAAMLGDRYDFEYRDHIDVKGVDGGMDVYLLKGRRV